tara:strand:+ start:10067 stop:11254 length:1188 start_codon:yes stop_codon:yes gene_type:complete
MGDYEQLIELYEKWIDPRNITIINKELQKNIFQQTPSKMRNKLDEFFERIWDRKASANPKMGNANTQRTNAMAMIEKRVLSGLVEEGDIGESTKLYRESLITPAIRKETKRISQPLFGEIVEKREERLNPRYAREINKVGNWLIEAKRENNKERIKSTTNNLLELRKSLEFHSRNYQSKEEILQEDDIKKHLDSINQIFAVVDKRRVSKKPIVYRLDVLDSKLPKVQRAYRKKGLSIDKRRKEHKSFIDYLNINFPDKNKKEILQEASQRYSSRLIDDPKIVVPRIELERRFTEKKYGKAQRPSGVDLLELSKTPIKRLRQDLGVVTKDGVKVSLDTKLISKVKRDLKADLKPRFEEIKKEQRLAEVRARAEARKVIREEVEKVAGTRRIPKGLV